MKTWRYIDEDEVTASYGLGADEYLIQTHLDESSPFPVSLRLYTYQDYAALAGRFQDIRAEIDVDACRKHNFQIGRRLTGGGAIIMGAGQLGICLTSHSRVYSWNQVRELYHVFSEPILLALQHLGIDARFREKNDLEANGKKIAGLGVYISPEGGIQFHCSLLLDLDPVAMLKVLKIPIQKIEDKRMIHAVTERITTIQREGKESLSMHQLKKRIIQSFESHFDVQLKSSSFSQQEKGKIAELEQNRYGTDEWIYQHSPQKDMEGMSLKKTAAGLLRTYIGLKGENIKSVLITGDFLGQGEALGKIESLLKWSPLDKNKIDEIVHRELAAVHEVGGLKAEEVTEAIWTASQKALAAQRYTYKGSCYYPKA